MIIYFVFLTFLRQVRLMPADDQKKFLYLQVQKHSQNSSHPLESLLTKDHLRTPTMVGKREVETAATFSVRTTARSRSGGGTRWTPTSASSAPWSPPARWTREMSIICDHLPSRRCLARWTSSQFFDWQCNTSRQSEVAWTATLRATTSLPCWRTRSWSSWSSPPPMASSSSSTRQGGGFYMCQSRSVRLSTFLIRYIFCWL